MSIWFKPFTLEQCAALEQGITGKGTLMQTLGIKVTEIGTVIDFNLPYRGTTSQMYRRGHRF